MSYTRIVIHGPKKEEDMQKLLHEISKFRAEKTMKYLGDTNISPAEITRIISEIHIPHHD